MNAGNLITDNIRKRFMRGAQAALILLMIVLTAGMMLQIRSLQGNARVVNYAGILRGATQRLVKSQVCRAATSATISMIFFPVCCTAAENTA